MEHFVACQKQLVGLRDIETWLGTSSDTGHESLRATVQKLRDELLALGLDAVNARLQDLDDGYRFA